MKNRMALILIGSLLLAGCAGKKAPENQALNEAPPAVVEQQAPVVAEESPPAETPVIAEAPAQEVAEEPAVDKIFFDFDSYLLTPASREMLANNALWMQALPEVRFVIQGHADERGSDTYNLALGEKRAQATRDYLVNLGIAPERIDIISYGEEKAARGAASDDVWAQDRRAEFVTAN